MQSVLVFDYSKISATEYGYYVFKHLISALSESAGTCRFNDGDVSRLHAKEIAANAHSYGGRLLQAARVKESTPLRDPDTDFPGGVYLVGLWTDREVNIDAVHAALDKPEIEGYVGCMVFTDPRIDWEEWNHLMRQQLYMPPNIELSDGQIVGSHNPYGVRMIDINCADDAEISTKQFDGTQPSMDMTKETGSHQLPSAHCQTGTSDLTDQTVAPPIEQSSSPEGCSINSTTKYPKTEVACWQTKPILFRIIGLVMMIMNTAVWWQHIKGGGPAILFYIVGLSASVGILLVHAWALTLCVYITFVSGIVLCTTFSDAPGISERRLTFLLAMLIALLPIIIAGLLNRASNKQSAVDCPKVDPKVIMDPTF